MAAARITVSDALHEALDFARCAWRDAWAPMGLTALGWTLLVTAAHARIAGAEAGALQKLGLVLLLFYIPLLGALYRAALGGRPFRGLGWGGLQLGGVEGRLVAVNAVLVFFALLACTPMILVSGILYMILRRFDGVTLGPLGHWEWWFLVAALAWTAFLAGLGWLAGRLALATPLSLERGRLLPLDSWLLTPGEGGAIARAFITAHLPTVFVLLALTVFGWIAGDGAPTGLHGGWPLPEALIAGLMAGLALSALQAPLAVGVIALFYDELAPLAHEDDAIAPPPALGEASPEPEPGEPDEAAVPSEDADVEAVDHDLADPFHTDPAAARTALGRAADGAPAPRDPAPGPPPGDAPPVHALDGVGEPEHPGP